MAQQSILSFFNSPAAAAVAPASSSATLSPNSRVPPPLRRLAPAPSPAAPPPPPSSARPGAVLRSGGSPAPNLDLAPITPAWGRAILLAAGAEERPASASDVDLVFPAPSAAAASASPRIVFPRDGHVPDLASVNGILLPVRYPDSFYRLVADRTRAASLFNRVLLGRDDGHVVGGIVCRLEPSPFAVAAAAAAAPADHGPPLAVYIQSLALLSPHRGGGLVAAALDSIVATAVALNRAAREEAGSGGGGDATGAWTHSIQTVYAHVWTENEDALRWYEARGFRRDGDGPVDNYYFKLRPSTAWVLRRDLGVAEQVAAAAATASTATATTTATTATATTRRPPPPPQSLSYQNARPATEWNDLPEDMVAGPSAGPSSAASSRAGSRTTSRQVSRQNLLVPPSSSSRSSSVDGMLSPPLPAPPPPPGGAADGAARKTGTGRKKRERAYPAAMFQQ